MGSGNIRLYFNYDIRFVSEMKRKSVVVVFPRPALPHASEEALRVSPGLGKFGMHVAFVCIL